MITADSVSVASEGRTRKYRALFAYAVLAIVAGLMLFSRVKDTRAGGAAYQTADWLINYGDGFVRRGLFGQLFLSVTPQGDAGGLWILFGVQSLLYLVIFVFAGWILHRYNYSWSMIALVCGPAAVGFFGWDPGSGFRKEVLAYVALAALVWALVPGGRPRRAVTVSLVSLLVFVVAVFSWETSALFAPAFLYLLLRRTDDLRMFRRWLAATFLVVAGAGLALGTVFHGTTETATAICDTVRAHGYTGAEICSGAIDAIGWTSSFTLASVAESFPLYAGYIPLIILGLVPVVATRWVRENWRWAVFIAIAFVPLFVIVTDYGRWTNMIVMALLFCIVAGKREDSFSPVWNPLATVLYVSLWGLPHWLPADDDQSWPWLGLVKTLNSSAIDLFGKILG